MPNRAKPQDYAVLSEVTTVAEAARITYRHPNTIRYAIDAGNVAAVKVGRVWLVSIRSLLAWFPVKDCA